MTTRSLKPEAEAAAAQLPDPHRRLVLLSALLASSSLSASCGGGGGGTNSQDAPPLAGGGSGGGGGVSPLPKGAYRVNQPYLFQPVPVAMPSTLGGSSYSFERWGPTQLYVDFQSGWAWGNLGGDYLDANLVRQGTQAWASVALNAVSGSAAVHEYTDIDVTALLSHVQRVDHWAALFLRMAPGSTVPRLIAGPLTPGGHRPPRIDISYTDGTTAQLSCRIVARSTGSSTAPTSTNQATGGGLNLPVFVEFERPAKPVSNARLRFTVVNHSSGSGSPNAEIFLCDPPVNAEPVTGQAGLGSRAGALDAGIEGLPGVIGAHRYVDGVTLGQFVSARSWGYNSESNFDPAIYGNGAENRSLLPHADLGKFIDASQDANLWSVVPSSYSGEGYEPLAPGLGALRVEMPNTNVNTGDEQRNGGTTAAAKKIMMPPDDYGRLARIFVRYYVRFGTPYDPRPSDRKEIRRFGSPEWTAAGGKWGITPEHATTYGGVSGSAGGGYGWTLRHKWADCDAAMGGPNEGGITSGWHLYDYQNNNPVGHRYVSDPTQREGWGVKGGLGGTIYAGRWYCIEQEVKLNSVDVPSSAGDGQLWAPDGELRLWLDGRLVYDRAGMVFRTLPLITRSYNGSLLRPVRELGVKALWFNWFHGGLNNSTYKRVMFVTGLVWARERIGPMRL
ncbi:MAG: hypothetical protein ACK5T3_19425 [Betaproteobacteria bacterium]